MKDYTPKWSNCMIESLKYKFNDWKGIRLLPIFHKFKFHMMWYDRRTNEVKHFTHASMEGWHSALFFKGMVETVNINKFKKWCKRENVNIHLDD